MLADVVAIPAPPRRLGWNKDEAEGVWCMDASPDAADGVRVWVTPIGMADGLGRLLVEAYIDEEPPEKVTSTEVGVAE